MNPEELVAGLEYAKKYVLTKNEIICIIPFFEKPHTAADVAKKEIINFGKLHHTLQILRLKGLLSIKDRDRRGNNLLELNVEKI